MYIRRVTVICICPGSSNHNTNDVWVDNMFVTIAVPPFNPGCSNYISWKRVEEEISRHKIVASLNCFRELELERKSAMCERFVPA